MKKRQRKKLIRDHGFRPIARQHLRRGDPIIKWNDAFIRAEGRRDFAISLRNQGSHLEWSRIHDCMKEHGMGVYRTGPVLPIDFSA